MKKLRILVYLIQKEFLQIRRNPAILRMMIMLPIIQLLVLPWAATFEQQNINLTIVDHDHSSYSREMLQKIIGSGYFKLNQYTESYAEALKTIETNESDIVLEIPLHFEHDLVRKKASQVMITINAVNGQKAGLGGNYLGTIIQQYNQEVLIKMATPEFVSNQINTIRPISSYRYNIEMNYRNYMVPGVLGMLLTLIGCMLSALNIVKEKELGTIEQINVTPVPKSLFILAKLIPFWLIGLLILTIGSIIAWLVYGIIPVGSFGTLYLFAFIYLVATTGLGLLISTYSETQQQAMFVMFFFIMIFFMLSGLFTPISSMPDWAQNMTRLNIVRYFVEVSRLIYMKGAGLYEIMPQLLSVLAFAFVFNVWAVLNYKKTN